ncbi:MAG: hypothetical protein M1826_004424 [Phylliscum demangeonii]|nr:MAG: hypothetical protein M1826_004424 [Phylliscum demangeonii]
MRVNVLTALVPLSCVALVAGRSIKPLTNLHSKYASQQSAAQRDEALHKRAELVPRAGPKYLTPTTTKFSVNGTGIPEVDFDVGESYAGLLPISSKEAEDRQLYFWFFPTDNPAGQDEITIWLNGGPGCSSLEGFLQENGPISWQHGTFKPVPNPYSWTNLTNLLYVEQPVGTGFSQGTPTATSEGDVAAQFLGFFENFVDTFGLHNKKIFVTGESYAGAYVPYIADAMLNSNNTKYCDVEATMIYDPYTTYFQLQQDVPVVPFVDKWSGLLPFNSTFNADIHRRADSCGFTSYMQENLVFPPKGPFPLPPDISRPECSLFNDVINAAFAINPCFDIYQVASTCPSPHDPLGFPGSFPYTDPGSDVYFNRADVQKAINAPAVQWQECTDKAVFVNPDSSPPSGLSVLPGVVERSKRTVIAHGALDMVLIASGTLMMIQNMTWNGAQGFAAAPSSDFFVPYHADYSYNTAAGAGVMGTTHTERGLTWCEVSLSGHMVPGYQPSAAYRQMEFLLGRIDSLETRSDFTTQSGDFGNTN